MKQQIYWLGLWLTIGCGQLSAQSNGSITSDVVFSLGDTALVHLGQGQWQPGASGQGVTWDLSQMPHDTAWVWRDMMPDTVAHRDSFPSATMAFNIPVGDTSASLSFYRHANDSLQYLGSAVTTSDGADVRSFNLLRQMPELIAAFPFEYGDSFSTTYRGINWVSFGGQTVRQTRYGEVSRTVDGQGTLITPFGTFDDALRVKTTQVDYDTTMVSGFAVAQQIRWTRYAWYAPGERYLLMEMDSSVMLAQGLPATVSYSHFFRMSDVGGGMTTALAEKLPALVPLTLSPNPTTDQVEIAWHDHAAPPAEVWLTDLQGREVLRQMWPTTQQDRLSIALPSLPQGVYLLHAQRGQSRFTRRLIIQ